LHCGAGINRNLTRLRLLQACQFACSKPDTPAAAAANFCGTAEGLEKVLDFPVPRSSSNAHAFRPRDAERRSPGKPQLIMHQASQLLAAVQQQQQQAASNAADQVSAGGGIAEFFGCILW
jgi:hypothetical protein